MTASSSAIASRILQPDVEIEALGDNRVCDALCGPARCAADATVPSA